MRWQADCIVFAGFARARKTQDARPPRFATLHQERRLLAPSAPTWSAARPIPASLPAPPPPHPPAPLTAIGKGPDPGLRLGPTGAPPGRGAARRLASLASRAHTLVTAEELCPAWPRDEDRRCVPWAGRGAGPQRRRWATLRPGQGRPRPRGPACPRHRVRHRRGVHAAQQRQGQKAAPPARRARPALRWLPGREKPLALRCTAGSQVTRASSWPAISPARGLVSGGRARDGSRMAGGLIACEPANISGG